jgi:hypothetical protein
MHGLPVPKPSATLSPATDVTVRSLSTLCLQALLDAPEKGQFCHALLHPSTTPRVRYAMVYALQKNCAAKEPDYVAEWLAARTRIHQELKASLPLFLAQVEPQGP